MTESRDCQLEHLLASLRELCFLFRASNTKGSGEDHSRYVIKLQKEERLRDLDSVLTALDKEKKRKERKGKEEVEYSQFLRELQRKCRRR